MRIFCVVVFMFLFINEVFVRVICDSVIILVFVAEIYCE